MDQQMALLRQEHEEILRQLKHQHSKELEAEVDRHREELETALTRAQLCLLSPSLPHNPPAVQEVETIKKERDQLLHQRDNLQQKVYLVTRELEESAKSLVAFDERLSEKDEKIARLKDEIKSLYLSLNNVTESNQALKEKSKSMKRLLNDSSGGSGGGGGGGSATLGDSSSGSGGDGSSGDQLAALPPPPSNINTSTSTSTSTIISRPRPHQPLFANPLLDRYWDLLYLAAFGFVLVIHYLFSCYFVHTQ